MSSAAIERLATSYETLIRALDGADADSLDQAAGALADAVEQVRSADLGANPALRDSLSRLLALSHAAQSRVNFMTDALGRRMENLAVVRGDARTPTYQPGNR